MRDAGGKAADSFHFEEVPDLGLKVHAVSHVVADPKQAGRVAGYDLFHEDESRAQLAGLHTKTNFHAADGAAFREGFIEAQLILQTRPERKIQRGVADCFFARVAEQIYKTLVHVEQTAFRQSGNGNGDRAGPKRA